MDVFSTLVSSTFIGGVITAIVKGGEIKDVLETSAATITTTSLMDTLTSLLGGYPVEVKEAIIAKNLLESLSTEELSQALAAIGVIPIATSEKPTKVLRLKK